MPGGVIKKNVVGKTEERRGRSEEQRQNKTEKNLGGATLRKMVKHVAVSKIAATISSPPGLTIIFSKVTSMTVS
jgi:hypothetical protein